MTSFDWMQSTRAGRWPDSLLEEVHPVSREILVLSDLVLGVFRRDNDVVWAHRDEASTLKHLKSFATSQDPAYQKFQQPVQVIPAYIIIHHDQKPVITFIISYFILHSSLRS